MVLLLLQTWGDFKTAFIEQMIKALPQTFDTFRIFMVLLSVWIAREVYKIRRGQKERQKRDREEDKKHADAHKGKRRASDVPSAAPSDDAQPLKPIGTFDEFAAQVAPDGHWPSRSDGAVVDGIEKGES